MAKQGFKVMDSDIHVDEPPDLWANYIDPKFREQAPNVKKWVQEFGLIGWNFAGKPFPAFIDNPDRAHAAEIRRGKMKIRDKESRSRPGVSKGRRPPSHAASDGYGGGGRRGPRFAHKQATSSQSTRSIRNCRQRYAPRTTTGWATTAKPTPSGSKGPRWCLPRM